MRLRISELREDKDIKQETVAKELFVSQSTYSRYETGEIEMPISMCIRIAEYFGTSIDYLVGLSDNRDKA